MSDDQHAHVPEPDLGLAAALGIWREDVDLLTDDELRALVQALSNFEDVRELNGIEKVSPLLIGHGWDSQGYPAVPDIMRSWIFAIARERFGE